MTLLDDLDDATYEDFVELCTCEHPQSEHGYAGCDEIVHGDYARQCVCKAHWEGDD